MEKKIKFLFHFSAISVLPFWGLMILFPNYSLTKSVISSPWIIVPPSICYIALLIPNLSKEVLLSFKNASPQKLAKIMARPWAASLFWTYAGAFDLFIGRWIYLDAQTLEINHFLIAPILLVSIFFGPVGFLLYAALQLFISAI